MCNMCLSRRDEIVGHIYNDDSNATIDIDNTTVDDINNNDKNSINTFKAVKTLTKNKSNF